MWDWCSRWGDDWQRKTGTRGRCTSYYTFAQKHAHINFSGTDPRPHCENTETNRLHYRMIGRDLLVTSTQFLKWPHKDSLRLNMNVSPAAVLCKFIQLERHKLSAVCPCLSLSILLASSRALLTQLQNKLLLLRLPSTQQLTVDNE